MLFCAYLVNLFTDGNTLLIKSILRFDAKPKLRLECQHCVRKRRGEFSQVKMRKLNLNKKINILLKRNI